MKLTDAWFRSSLIEAFWAAWRGVQSSPVRSILTMSGITIGVASVIIVAATLQGLQGAVAKSFDGLGRNSLTVSAYTPIEQRLRGQINRLTLDDYQAIVENVKGVNEVSPVLLPVGPFGANISSQDRSTFAQIYGVTQNYQDVYNLSPSSGRFINPIDNKERRKVIVIGAGIVDELWEGGSALGQYVFYEGDWYKVIGIMEEKGDIFGVKQDNFVLVPFSTLENNTLKSSTSDLIINLSIDDASEVEFVQDEILRVLRSRHGSKSESEDSFRVDTPKQLNEKFSTVTDSISAVAIGLIGISLVVGGIGIMNMMFTTVTERTREIGICKALGARRSDIMLQFLLEAIILALSGALVGVVAGLFVALLIPVLIPMLPAPEVPLWSIFTSVVFSIMTGIFFGVLPAANAANLSPVEALRYE